MNRGVRSLLPALFLAAGILVATAVSLLSRVSFGWALAGPFLLGVIVVAAAALRNRVLDVTVSYATAVILGGAVFLGGALVAMADPAGVPMIMPILGGSSVMVLTPSRRCANRIPQA